MRTLDSLTMNLMRASAPMVCDHREYSIKEATTMSATNRQRLTKTIVSGSQVITGVSGGAISKAVAHAE